MAKPAAFKCLGMSVRVVRGPHSDGSGRWYWRAVRYVDTVEKTEATFWASENSVVDVLHAELARAAVVELGRVLPVARPRSQPEPRWAGIVYFVREGEHGPIKIGHTKSRHPGSRLKSLQTGNPRPLRVVGWVHGSLQREKDYHRLLHGYRLVGEWFEAGPVLDLMERIGANVVLRRSSRLAEMGGRCVENFPR